MYGNCALFEFSLTIRFELEDTGIFECTGPELPLSLNGVNYINDQGYLHFSEVYVINFMQYTYFALPKASYFKAAAKPLGNVLGFSMMLFNSENLEYYFMEEDTIFLYLAPGNYSFFLSAFSVEIGNCPEGTANPSLAKPFSASLSLSRTLQSNLSWS